MKNETQDGRSPSPHSDMSLSEMTCSEVLDQLEAHLDGELSPERAAAMTRHLRACAACADEQAWARQVRGGLRGLPQLSCPPRLLESLAQSSAAPARETLAEVVPLASRRPRSAVPAAGDSRQAPIAWRPLLAAGVAGLAVALTLLWGPGPDGSGIPVPGSGGPGVIAEGPSAAAGDAGVALADATAAGVELPDAVPTPVDPFALDAVPRVSPVGMAGASAGPDARELAQAEEEMRFALAYINGIHRQAALALRDQMREHVAAAPYRSLQRLSLIDTPSS